MWQLSIRDENRDWTELGTFAGIGPAVRHVLGLERPGEPVGSLFFRIHADPLMETSDAEILSRLEYQGAKGFYVLKRQTN